MLYLISTMLVLAVVLAAVWLCKHHRPGLDRAVLALARSMDSSTQFVAAPKHRR